MLENVVLIWTNTVANNITGLRQQLNIVTFAYSNYTKDSLYILQWYADVSKCNTTHKENFQPSLVSLRTVIHSNFSSRPLWFRFKPVWPTSLIPSKHKLFDCQPRFSCLTTVSLTLPPTLSPPALFVAKHAEMMDGVKQWE